ncbi:MAG: tripartite tricarboxylate transporter substrate binding protein BugD [Alphaproteobacteria bacterium]|nr:tripartite tricarboxylate transporter substrate binding protein BugD [Alphaproteobacteria bacterium]
MSRIVAAFVSLLLAAAANPTQAQDFPTRPITIVAPFAAGGGNDVLGRLIAQPMADILGQPVLIENVPGAGGMTGSNRVAKAAPDGYTLGLGSVGSHAFNQTLYKRPLYNAATDFAPVAMIADQPLLLVARKDLPANSLKEFIAHAKANAKTMQHGSAGVGSATHLGCVLLNREIGVEITHVPYRGGAPAMTDLIAGRIDYWCPFSTTAMPQVKGGTIKPIALLALQRLAVLPDLPTAHEQGLANFEASTWNAMFAPKGTPPAVIRKLYEATVKAVESAPVQARLRELGLSPAAPDRRSPEFLAKFVVSEIEKWAVPIKAAGISVD